MKHFSCTLMAVCITMLTCSCNKDAEISTTAKQTAPVTVTVNDFSMSVESFAPATRTTSPVADYEGVKAITLAFYDSNDSQVYLTTQLRANSTTYTSFGQFSCNLPIGNYTMVVLGYGSENEMTLSSKSQATFTNDRVRETFIYTQAVNVTSTSALDLSATLSRVVARLEVQSTDGRTADAAKLRTIFSAGGQGVNPLTGMATSNAGFSNTVEINYSVGAYAGSINYLFLNSDQQNMNVTIDVLDADDNILTHKVVNDVPLQRNRVTRLSGRLFSSASSSSFQVETSWLTQQEPINF